jgi:gamma-glutamyltranspeptidase / glutathione hydrolase / leukotriene-C4 hydrolase
MSKTITVSLPLHIDRVYKEKEAMLPVYVPLNPQTRREKSHSWRARGLVVCIVLFVLGWIFYHSRNTVTNQPVPVARNPSFLIKAKSGAVASENVVCSQMGVDTLKDGGNAVDAAIATTLCIGVVNMFS